MEIACSAYLSLEEITHWCINFRVMAPVELNLNATYAQNSALKLVYEKSQYVMGGKLFSSYSTVQLAQGLWDSKTSNLNCLYEALALKE